MNSLIKINNVVKNIGTTCLKLNSCRNIHINLLQPVTNAKGSIQQVKNQLFAFNKTSIFVGAPQSSLHLSAVRLDLMQFFDDPKNWTETEVKHGRSWKTDELRIKSNKELHQLWYILLKERNMLLTMEHECNDKMEVFPSPERLDKVKISMENVETVIRERNKAYHLLECGTTGERPVRVTANALGFKLLYRSSEHVLPPHMNTKWIKSRNLGYGGRAVRKFLLLYREKLWNIKRKAKNRNRNEVMMLLRRNPNLDVENLRRQFPDVDIKKLIRTDKTRGHFVPKIES